MYLPIDEGFVSHRKTLRFCGYMQDANAFAYLLRLWSWAARSAPDGSLDGLSPFDIEHTVQYRNADGRCYGAMVKAGFIDEREPTVPAAIHNWMERIGASIAKMEAAADAAKTRRKRWKDAQGTRTETPRGRGGDAVEDDDGCRPEDDDRETVGARDAPRQGKSKQDLISLAPSSPPGNQAGARAVSTRHTRTPLTGTALCQTFGMIRSQVLGVGLPWQGVRTDHAKAADMAERIEAEGAAEDVPPTMRLFFKHAKDGKYTKASEMVRDPAFAFGAWCSKFTPLREELHDRQPAAPLSPEERQRADARDRAARASAADVAATDRKIAELRQAKARSAPPPARSIGIVLPDGGEVDVQAVIAELAEAKA